MAAFSSCGLAAELSDAKSDGLGRVMFWYDTEDYVTPESMDGALFHADLLTEFGFRGNFNVVGFYAQRLLERGRLDVVNALKRHCIGSQTLYHSRHPSICEYTDLKDWGEAYRRCLAEESDCIGRLKAVFGLDEVSFFCPPGTSVTPVAMYVYSDLGARIYGGGLDVFGNDETDRLVWYANMLHLPYRHVFGTTTGDASLVDELAGRRITVIATHPCNVVTRRFWDGVNYRGGNLCAWRKWKMPPLLTPDEQAAARQAWRDLMRRIKDDRRLKVVSCDDLLGEMKPRVAITRADVPSLLRAMEAGLEPVESPASWCVSDVFQAAVAFLRGKERFVPSKAWGFLERPVGVRASTKVRRCDLVAAAAALDADGFVPPQIRVGDAMIGPADFLVAALKVLATGENEVEVTPRDQIGPIAKHLPKLPDFRIGRHNWGIYSEDFKDEYLSDRLRWQFWTLRYENPSVRRLREAMVGAEL